MGLKEIGEFGFIRRVTQGCLVRPDGVLKGIGDDAAAFRTAEGRITLLTTDLLVERVHFIRDRISGFDLGYKSLAVNLSDIAAMGGTPREAFVSIAIPEEVPLDYLDHLYDGMKSLAQAFSVNILGGDTTGSRRDLVINVAVTGEVPEAEILFRHTARTGDIVFITGPLGDSRAGLHLILQEAAPESPMDRGLIEAHLRPRPHIREGRFLAGAGGVHAAIDVSDGLSSDLGHIAEASGLGVLLSAAKIPFSDHLPAFCKRFGFDPVDFALAGGEDYVLVCTVDPARAEDLAKEYRRLFGRILYPIGRMNSSGRLEIETREGRIIPFTASGWNHFQAGDPHGNHPGGF